VNLNASQKSLGWIIALAVVALAAPSVIAASAQVHETVFERPVYNKDLTASFEVDRQHSQGWIEVKLTPHTYFEFTDSIPEVVRRNLDGLYYDAARRELIYRNGTRSVVCAEDSHFLGTPTLKETGQCKLRVSTEERAADNGLKQTVATVLFEATPSVQQVSGR
jgi:hypothetical protein